VVTRGVLAVPDGVIVAPSLDAALAVPGGEATFLVGGAELIRAAIERPDLRFIYLTRIAGDFACDVRLPDLDALGWAADAWPDARDGEDAGVRYRIERLARTAAGQLITP
jgi:dihydrofolate reductase